MRDRVFPARGQVWKVLERELWEAKTHDMEWKHGVFGLNWPEPNRNLHLVAKEAANIFFNNIMLGQRLMQPSVAKVYWEVAQMAEEILNAPEGAHCTLTGGGTESNFLAVKTARDWAREHRVGAKTPEILMPYTAHPSFDKAAHYLGLETVRVPEGPDYRADVTALAGAVTENTIMIAGSAPAYPHGLIDPISGIAEIAQEHGLWCHVDASVGAYLIPFLKKLGHELPDFDFTLPGVMSISADPHKFGYAPLGVSNFILRDSEHLKYQRFAFDDWPRGPYGADTSPPGAQNAMMVAAAWAVMKHLGEDGYLDIVRGILRTTRMVVDGIGAIDGLEVLTEPEAGILVFTSHEFDLTAIEEGMAERGYRGYPTSRRQSPPVIHLLMDPIEDDRFVEDYLTALAEVVVEVRSHRAMGDAASD